MLLRCVICCVMVVGCDSRVDVADVVLDAPPVSVEGMRYSTPVGWLSEVPESPSRIAQYRLPSGDLAEDDAQLVVYYFGQRGAGSTDANLDRWIGQFEQPDGAPSADEAVISVEDINGLKVHRLDLDGTYVAETSPGSGEQLLEQEYRLRGAIVETEAGPYYVKLVGPSRVVERWRGSFDAFVESLESAPVGDEERGAEHP